MAAPITHIVLAQKVFNKYFEHLDEKSFYIGTSFPDIRYLNVIDRNTTHPAISTIKDVYDDSPFISGLKFHVLIDKVREDFIVSKGFYNLLPNSKFITQALKFYEDKLLYNYVTNWDVKTKYFDSILKEELDFGISEEKITQWHQILKEYLSAQPNTENLHLFISRLGLPDAAFEEINSISKEIENNKKIKDSIFELYEGIEELL